MECQCFFSQVIQQSSDVLHITYCTSSQMIPPCPRKLMKRHVQMPARVNAPSAQEGELMLSMPPSVVKALFFMMKNIIKRHYVPS